MVKNDTRTSVTLWTKTLDILRDLAAADNRSIVATIHRLAVDERQRRERRAKRKEGKGS